MHHLLHVSIPQTLLRKLRFKRSSGLPTSATHFSGATQVFGRVLGVPSALMKVNPSRPIAQPTPVSTFELQGQHSVVSNLGNQMSL